MYISHHLLINLGKIVCCDFENPEDVSRRLVARELVKISIFYTDLWLFHLPCLEWGVVYLALALAMAP